MGTLIDSSVLIAAERGKLDLADKLIGMNDEPIALAAITASELLHGVWRAATTAQKAQREATATALGYQVATRDLRSFPKVPGLQLLRW